MVDRAAGPLEYTPTAVDWTGAGPGERQRTVSDCPGASVTNKHTVWQRLLVLRVLGSRGRCHEDLGEAVGRGVDMCRLRVVGLAMLRTLLFCRAATDALRGGEQLGHRRLG